MKTMRCLRCESVLFVGSKACPSCGATEVTEFAGPRTLPGDDATPAPGADSRRRSPRRARAAPGPAMMIFTGAGICGLLAAVAVELF